MPRKSSKAKAVDSDPLETLARAALAEVTPAATVGALVEVRPGAEEGLQDLVFAPELAGYTGWSWIVTVATVPDAVSGETGAPTVLELGLLPGDGALLAPAWVPWSVRLAEWEAQQAALAAEAAAAGAEAAGEDGAEDTGLDDRDLVDTDLVGTGLGDGEDDLDADDDEFDDDDDTDDEDDTDDDELDGDDDFDEDDLPVTHGGDIDGVDIDEFDDSEPSAED